LLSFTIGWGIYSLNYILRFYFFNLAFIFSRLTICGFLGIYTLILFIGCCVHFMSFCLCLKFEKEPMCIFSVLSLFMLSLYHVINYCKSKGHRAFIYQKETSVIHIVQDLTFSVTSFYPNIRWVSLYKIC
jgi:hypothetical protein